MRRPLAQTPVRDALDSAVIALGAAGVETPRLDAEVLLAAAMGVDRAVIVADPGRLVEPVAARLFMDFAARRRAREPVAYILGCKGFRSIMLGVDPRVLIPRPETEHLVEAVLGAVPAGGLATAPLAEGARVCDVGTGSGAIALALKSERPDLELVATDASADALDVARANADRLGLAVEFHAGDLLADVGGALDAIVSNPPYVEDGARLAPEIAGFEPALALRSGPDGLDVIRRLLPAAGATGARLVALEIGSTQAAVVTAMTREAGFPDVHVDQDLAGLDRVVVGRRP